MFCSKCGNVLEDTARFCDKCGNPTGVGEVNSNIVKEKKVDDEVQLVVKPKFKAIYFMLPAIIASVIVIVLSCLFAALEGLLVIGLLMSLGISAVILVTTAISMLFKKIQMKNMEFTFYNTKIVYKDSFLNQVEKEVKYKNVRECILTRTIFDRIFGFGRIAIFTNAESGYANGIGILYVENSAEVYKRIKELLDN